MVKATVLNRWVLHLGLIFIIVWSNTRPSNCWATPPGQFFLLSPPRKKFDDSILSYSSVSSIGQSGIKDDHRRHVEVLLMLSIRPHSGCGGLTPRPRNLMTSSRSTPVVKKCPGRVQTVLLTRVKNLIGFLEKLGPLSFWRCHQHGGWQCWFKRFQASSVQIPRGAGGSSGRLMVYDTNCPGFKPH